MIRTRDNWNAGVQGVGVAALRRTSRRRAAFTLVELLVVIALTALLLALLFAPIIQGFRLTNKARALAEAQDASRFGLERIRRELTTAAYVFDNSNAPITLPLADPAAVAAGNDPRVTAYGNVYPPNPTGAGLVSQPNILYGKIDFIPAATAGEDPNGAIDPTTDKPLGGTPVVLPVSPGRRYVRLFVGLRRPFQTDAAGVYQGAAYYENVYEFPRTDNNLNPFILYRAEYDPANPNLVNRNADPYAFNGAGLNDPNFFYNPNRAPNGRTYAENWRDTASPVLGTTNLDVLAWRRNTANQVEPGSPFQLVVNFSPATVAGDTATPGFVVNNAAETPGAVPSIYSAKFGQWTYPFTVSVFRGATQYGSTRPLGFEPYGNLQVVVDQVYRTDGSTFLGVHLPLDGAGNPQLGAGTLPADYTNNPWYWLFDTSSNKIFVFTRNLTFQIDPARGQVEAALPPLATQGGVPLYVRRDTGAVEPLRQASLNPNDQYGANYGQLVPTVFRQNSRDDDQTRGQDNHYAGQQFGDYFLPRNQGILDTSLANPTYYALTAPLPVVTNPGVAFPSPFVAFGGAGAPAGSFRGAMLVPGSERVMGPDNNLTLDTSIAGSPRTMLYTYNRVPVAVQEPQKSRTFIDDPAAAGRQLYLFAGPLQYQLRTDLGDYNAPRLTFDVRPTGGDQRIAPGVPARTSDDDPNAAPQAEIQISFLWQNNYARNADGEPVNEVGEATTRLDSAGAGRGGSQQRTGSARPEADIFKVDYATRQLLNVSIGARVYDTSSGTPQVATNTAQVQVSNVSR